MNFNLVTNIESCYQFIQSNPLLLYYSHIPTAAVSLLLALFVFVKNRKNISARLLLMLSIFFSLWSYFDLIIWTTTDGSKIMFTWAYLGVIYMLIYVSAVYLFYSFLNGCDISLNKKLIFGMLLLPVIILSMTNFHLSGFDVPNCESTEAKLYTDYYYIVGFLLLFWILGVSFFRYRKAIKREEKRKILLFTIGIGFFLLSFSISSYWASLFDNFEWEQYGLFGMPVFIGFLAYLIVKFKAFDIKLIGAQALVVTQFLLIAAMLTVVTSMMNYILVSITLIITLVAGWILIRSVKAEVERKEELQKLSNSLAVANDRLRELDMAKSEFISIASHQLRTPLTAIKGYVSLILEGSYGKVPVAIQDVLDKLYTINSRLVQLVEDLLNISRIEAGRIQYAFAPTQLEPLVAELVDMFALAAKNKKLSLKIHLPKVGLPKLTLDAGKIKEVVSNLIDNALKYTKEGGVTVSVEGDDRVARIIVSDTGIGIHPEDKNKLFEKFSRSNETTKMVVSGTGLGLFVGKNFVEAHGGHIHVESDGPGKGARFIIELPLINPKIKAGTSDQASFSGVGKK